MSKEVGYEITKGIRAERRAGGKCRKLTLALKAVPLTLELSWGRSTEFNKLA